MSRDPRPGRLLLAGGIVFDGTGADPAPADVVLEGNRIVEVGIGLNGDTAIDCTGHTVMPGLIDCHVHLCLSTLDQSVRMAAPFSLQFYEAAANMAATLAAGVTTVRDAGGADAGIKTAQQRGLITGPRVQTAISILSQTGGHADGWQPSGCHVPFLFVPHPGRPAAVVDGPEEMRKKVRQLVRAGADVIKVATTGGVLSTSDDPWHAHFRGDELAMLMREARDARVPVMAHAHTPDGIKTAIRAGVRSVEHGTVLDEETIELMTEFGTWLVPTLSAAHAVLDPDGPGAALPADLLEQGRRIAAQQGDGVRRAVEAGVRIAMGTDAGISPHGDNPHELELLIDAGLTPQQALHAASGSAARLLGLDDLGTVQAGKRADLLIVAGEALDLRDLPRRLTAVVQDGVPIHRPGPLPRATTSRQTEQATAHDTAPTH